jgi:hypothetical protein
LPDQCVITRKITVAVGAFAPGHLGELTQLVPFEMVDAALAATATTRLRTRRLPARVVVYLLLAGCLFAELGYRQVWHKLTAGLSGVAVANPSDNALWQARARLGAAPLRWLFDLLRGPAAAARCAGVYWCGLLVCAIDGTTMAVPDSARALAVYGKQAGRSTSPTAQTSLAPIADTAVNRLGGAAEPAAGLSMADHLEPSQCIVNADPSRLLVAPRYPTAQASSSPTAATPENSALCFPAGTGTSTCRHRPSSQ